MKILNFLLICFFQISCQSHAPHQLPRFDKKSLETHFKTTNVNVVIMWDQRINKVDEEGNFPLVFKKFLNNFLENYRARILITGLDGNPPYFFLSSISDDLPSDFSSLFYQVDQLNLAKLDRRYNPNISILKSAKEIINNFTIKKFFIPSNDFLVFVMSTKDDEDYLVDMDGRKYQDKFEDDIQALIKMNQSRWIVGEGKKQEYSYSQLRLFVAGPKTPCHKIFSSAERLFFASAKINTYYTGEEDNWQRQKENYNLCDLNFKSFFDNAMLVIEHRYEKSLRERELIPTKI